MAGIQDDVAGLRVENGAARAYLYDAKGEPLHRSWLARGVYQIKVRQSAATGAGAHVWALRNPGPRAVYVKRLWWHLFFDGTAAATLMRYELVKGTGVTVFSGGAAVVPLLKRTAAAPLAECRVLDTGLALTGFALNGVGHEQVHGRVTQTTTVFNASVSDLEGWESFGGGPIELGTNETLSIRQVATSVIGDNVVGACEIEEV